MCADSISTHSNTGSVVARTWEEHAIHCHYPDEVMNMKRTNRKHVSFQLVQDMCVFSLADFKTIVSIEELSLMVDVECYCIPVILADVVIMVIEYL